MIETFPPLIQKESKSTHYFKPASEAYLNKLVKKGVLRRLRSNYRMTDKGYLLGYHPEQFHTRRVRP